MSKTSRDAIAEMVANRQAAGKVASELDQSDLGKMKAKAREKHRSKKRRTYGTGADGTVGEVTYNVHMPKELNTAIKVRLIDSDLTVNDILVEALAAYLAPELRARDVDASAWFADPKPRG